ncbi:flavin reductase family protein [Roseococcus sp. YIM B11640]|uniref:flavin reductase family protein n=1 Tax=Roseococcus sp. YIM B11640 TaxID=3133973 RepID=UPI003C7E74A6
MLFDFEALPASERYKLLVSSVVPRPIAWVVSQDEKGVVNAAPFSFFNVFTDDPAVLAIGCGPHPKGHAKDTLNNIKATGQFVVCLVPHSHIQEMNVTATDFAAEVDEISEAGLTQVPSTKIKVPRIGESPVAMECETFQLIPVGHHTIVMGKILAMHIHDEAVLDPVKHYVDTPKLDLVGRMHGRGWYARTTDRVEVPRISVADWEARKKG